MVREYLHCGVNLHIEITQNGKFNSSLVSPFNTTLGE